ncbi:MAG: hypothetical protein M3O01_04700 [Pseudomonadota bacterium]|nr:hypothetical protein [Pseudomonadota bacterium]
MKNRRALALGCAALVWAMPVWADVKLVMFRHGEKPSAGLGQLSCQGLNRALALPGVLIPAYGTPAAIFAPNPGMTKTDEGVAYNYLRPLATVEPTAIRVGLPVNTAWAWNDIAHLQTELLKPAHEGQTLYVAWEHHELEQLARSILKTRGADPGVVSTWQGSDFDTVYVLTLPTAGGATFKVEKEGLDNQSSECPVR